jgi:alpha-aminoadipic semialdehyde synthase
MLVVLVCNFYISYLEFFDLRLGTIDILNGLGERILARGFRTPWLHIAPSRYYEDLDAAKHIVTRVGALLDISPPQVELGPFVFTVTGDGNVACGALDILKCMPHQVRHDKFLNPIFNLSSL